MTTLKEDLEEILRLSDLENIFSADEMQTALEKIHERAESLLKEISEK